MPQNSQRPYRLRAPLSLLCAATLAGHAGELRFADGFDGDLSGWRLNRPDAVGLVDSGEADHGRVLELRAEGLVHALIDESDRWGPVRIEADIFFPSDVDSYLGIVWGYTESSSRSDFGSIYLKADDSYLRANPWRDGNASRLLYEEYRVALTGEQTVGSGGWYRIAAEIADGICHFYVGDGDRPSMTFDLFEQPRGLLGFKPRIAGGPVWIDNVRVVSIEQFSYTGPPRPQVAYAPAELLTDWQVAGPFEQPVAALEGGPQRAAPAAVWRLFATDRRGAVITGRVTEYSGKRPVAYFSTVVEADEAGAATLHFSSVDELAVWVNGRFYGFVYRNGYVGVADWNAWHDFYRNPAHAGRKLPVDLEPGANRVVVRVRNGQFASGGFFARLER